jgi:hypothetical protein
MITSGSAGECGCDQRDRGPNYCPAANNYSVILGLVVQYGDMADTCSETSPTVWVRQVDAGGAVRGKEDAIAAVAATDTADIGYRTRRGFM